LWDESQANANHAFWVLANQGYTKENIQYLNRNTQLDLDGNGKPDDVDGLPTRANLKAALTEWAKDGEDVVLYMIGHGGAGTFQLGGGEVLQASELNQWLTELQAVMPGKVTVIYDACESGSFQPLLTNSTYPRTVITSTRAGENAYFQDAISFSHLFWNQVFSGKPIEEAFQATHTSITQAFLNQQTPQLDSNGDGLTNTPQDYTHLAQQAIGNGIVYAGTAPTIDRISVSPVNKGETTATITAYNVADDQAIQSVWGMITPPYANLTQKGTPVQNLPRFDLTLQADGSYQGQFDGFEQPGTYQITVYAQDQSGNTSYPQVTTLNVISPLSRKAVLVTGVDSTGQLTPALQAQTDYAYRALKGQGYADTSIDYQSASNVGTVGVDRASSREGLEFVLTQSTSITDTSDLVVYLAGDIIAGDYYINPTERVSLTDLTQWLNQAQANIQGTLTVILEGNGSGTGLAALSAVSSSTAAEAKRWLLISSSALGENNYLLNQGDLSFSRYFWSKVTQGATLADAFNGAEAAMRRYQSPQINSNGNNQSNEKDDRTQARYYALGLNILLAADEPSIGQVADSDTLTTTTQSTLWVDQIVSLAPIESVWAEIIPPEYDSLTHQTGVAQELALSDVGNGRWQSTPSLFTQAGTYTIHYYAKDTHQRISVARTSYVTQTVGVDAYEVKGDNDRSTASTLSSLTHYRQWHNFHDSKDQDFIRFEADPSRGQYTLKVDSLNSTVDAVIHLYDSQGNPLALLSNSHPDPYTLDSVAHDSVELAYWLPPETGTQTYYLQISPAPGTATHNNLANGYWVSVYPTNAPQDAVIQGVIRNKAGTPLAGVKVYTLDNQQYTTQADGRYELKLRAGSTSLIADASGYQALTLQLNPKAGESLSQDLTLTVKNATDPDDPTLNPQTQVPIVQVGKLLKTEYPITYTGALVVQALQLNLADQEAVLSQLSIKGSGSGHEVTDLKGVKLYHDINQNQQVDAEDSQLGATQTYQADNGTLSFILAQPYALSKGTQQLIVNYER
ncbi:MAG: carboxypeptidase regulatory-like domain-containing protein, partial [Thiofilum sp.]